MATLTAILALDRWLGQALYSVRDPFLVQFFIWISELGNETTIFGIAFIAMIIFAYRKRLPDAIGLAVSVFGSAGVLFVLKELVARARPSGPFPAYIETSFSFPSGHATLSIALYAFLLWAVYDAMPPLWKKMALSSASILILAIGFSRLYLGVHYLSDVLAGYLLGGIFVFLGIAAVKKLKQRVASA